MVEVGPEAREFKVGDLLYLSVDHVEYAVRPETGLLIKLPETVDPKHAALFGMSSVAMHTCRNADLRMGERVLVVGAGVIGQVATQIAAAMGARATLCDVDDRRLELAAKIGAAEEIANVAGDGWAEHVPDGAFDAVIDLAGAPGMEDKLIMAARRRGRVLLIAGRPQVSYTFNLGNEQEVVIKQNRHFDNGDLAHLCRLVSRGTVRRPPDPGRGAGRGSQAHLRHAAR